MTSNQSPYPKVVAESIARDISTKAKKYSPTFTDSVAIWSNHLVYQVCVIYIRLLREAGNADDLEALKATKETLSILNRRWKSAGVSYVQEMLSVNAGSLLLYRCLPSDLGGEGGNGNLVHLCRSKI
jgi:hypothetical protein